MTVTKEDSRGIGESSGGRENIGWPLAIAEVGSGLHEKAEGLDGRQAYSIRWKRRPRRLLGLVNVPGSDHASGTFIRLPIDGMNLPPEASSRLAAASNHGADTATAVFLDTDLRDTHLRLLLAVRLSGKWFGLWCWTASWQELGVSRPSVARF